MSDDLFNRRHLLRLAGAMALTGLAVARGHAQARPSLNEVIYDADQPLLGNPHGDVTIVEYFDFQCPYCKSGFSDLLAIVRKDGNTRLIMKDWVIFGDVSSYAARLVLAADQQGDYERALTAVMRTSGRLSAAKVDASLVNAGLDPRQLHDLYARQRGRIDQLLLRNASQAEAFGFRGTPSYLIGTQFYRGVLTPSDFYAAIDHARRKQL